jgi:hypothetical protein
MQILMVEDDVLVLVRLDHVTSFIVNANPGIMVNGCKTLRRRLHC